MATELRYQKNDVVQCKHCKEFTPIYDNIFKPKKHRSDLEGQKPARKKRDPKPEETPAPGPPAEEKTEKPTETIEHDNKTFW